jgi:hypothetical protein
MNEEEEEAKMILAWQTKTMLLDGATRRLRQGETNPDYILVL